MEWISVNDRLPEGRIWVLACFDSTVVEILPCWYFESRKQWYQMYNSKNVTDLLTHWMPFPEPPKTN